MGAQPRTLAGLAGLGDLVLTCTGDLSRNRRLGDRIKSPLIRPARCSWVIRPLPRVSAPPRVAVDLGKRFGVEMPIASEMRAVLEEGRSPDEAIRRLMERSLKEE